MNRLIRSNIPQSGFIVPAVLIMMLGLIAIGTVTMSLASSNFQIAQSESFRLSAQLAADAGADAAVQQLNTTPTWTGTGGSEVTVLNTTFEKTTYTAIVTDDPVDTLKKTIAVTGRSYSPATSTTPKSVRKYEIGLRGVGGGSYAVVTGVGGLTMENSAKIVGGDVYVNGTISLKNSAQIGLTTSPVSVKAAHQSCPISFDSTYPRVCNNGENGQPISIQNSAKIYGEVRATNQTNGAGMQNPGLVAGSTAEPLPLPTHDRSAQVAAVTSTISGGSAGCSSGTKTWNANLKVTSDVSISNGCKVTVHGDVWITGKLTLSNSSELIVLNGLTEPPEIMIDGNSGIELSNSSVLRSNNSSTPVGFRVLTYWSTASCSPDCSSVTGIDLANSRGNTTIKIDNGSSGPNTEFYARWTAVTLSNSGNVGAVVGQTVKLTNSAAITFGTPVSGTNVPSAWVVENYRRTY